MSGRGQRPRRQQRVRSLSPGEGADLLRTAGPLPAHYKGPRFADKTPTPEEMAKLLAHIKRVVAADASAAASSRPAVPIQLAVQLMVGVQAQLKRENSALVDVKHTEGRMVLVGDTHGQLNDFCWMLKAHGPPAPGNVYLVNGDIADRGGFATEIYLLLFGYMLACPGCVLINRGNHESHDMNVRAFSEGGGFSSEVSAKYEHPVHSL